MTGRRFTVRARGPFSLDEARRFLEGLRPAGGLGGAPPRHMHLAFVAGGDWLR